MSRRSALWVQLTPVGVLVLGLILRLYQLGAKSLSEDEGYTIAAARGPLDQIWTSLISDHVPLYFGFMWLWVRAAGDAEWVVRLPSVLLGVASLAALMAIGLDLGRPRAGLIAAALGAVSPFAVYWSQEAKPVALQMAVATWSTWALLRAVQHEVRPTSPFSARVAVGRTSRDSLRRGTRQGVSRLMRPFSAAFLGDRRWWVAWWAMSLIGIYSHYYHGFVLVGQVVWLLAVRIASRDWRAVAAVVAGQAVLALAFVPWILGHAALVSQQVPEFVQPAPMPLESFVAAAVTALLAADPGQGAPIRVDVPVALGIAAASLLGLLTAVRQRCLIPVVTLSAVAIATLVVGAHLLDRFVPHFVPRYFVGVFPLVQLLAALGLDALLRSTAAIRTAAVVGLGALGIAWGATTLDTYTGARYEHPGIREVVDYFVAHRSPGDLLTGDPAWVGPTYGYYLNGADDYLQMPFFTGNSAPGDRIDLQIQAWRAAGIQHVWSASLDGVPSRLDLQLENVAQPTDLHFAYRGAAIQQYALQPDAPAAALRPLAADYPDVLLQDHPAGYWRLDDAAGPTVRGEVGAISGSYVGGYELGVQGATGDGETAVRLDGQGGLVRVSGDPLPAGVEAVSIEGWLQSCRLLAGTGSNRWMGKIQEVGLFAIGWEGWNGGWTVQLTTDQGPIAVNAPAEVQPGEWLHVVGTYDGSTLRLFLNGRLAALRQVGPQSLSKPIGRFEIGSLDNPSRDATWDGTIDDVAIYDHALSPDSVDRHFQAAHPKASRGYC